MNRTSVGLWPLILGPVVSLISALVSGEEPKAFDPVAEIAAADSGPKLNAVYSRLFLKADWKTIDELKGHDHDGIALQAAWEEVRRSIPLEGAKRLGEKAPLLDAKKTQRFIGFVEGRLKVTPPPFWEDLLLRARAERRIKWDEVLTTDLKRHLHLLQEIPVSQDGKRTVMVPFDLGVDESKQGTSIDVTLDKKTFAVPLTNAPWGINAWPVGKSRCVVALISSISPNHEIICIDGADQSVAWKSRVWGETVGPIRSGWSPAHFVDARLSGDRLLIFGVTFDRIYIEGFSISDGKNLFRFSSGNPQEIIEKKK
jgi:hypothetical protein